MKLSAKARYAVRILLDLALHDDSAPVSTADTAGRTGVSVRFIEQILKPLKKDGLVRSTRGAAGGYTLAAPPQDISLARVIRAVEGKLCLSQCSGDPSSCSRSGTCSSRKAWVRVTRVLEDALEGVSIRDLRDDVLEETDEAALPLPLALPPD